ncbi:LamG-like jellyroll fold domain-containing protein [Candidatus Sumerlaeota bacterium]
MGKKGVSDADRSSFANAIAVWHMDDLNDSVGKNSALTIHGDVKVGVELTGMDREASLKRGGDGRVAEFNGGYLSAGQGVDGELNLTGKEMTMCIRLRDPSGAWDAPLFGKYDGDKGASYHLYGMDGASKPFYAIPGKEHKVDTPFYDLFAEGAGPKAISGNSGIVEFVWGTEPRQDIVDGLTRGGCGDPMLEEARNGVMKVNFPVAWIGPTDWHDLVVRFTGPKLDLFIDGVLVDEEFPIGSLRQNAAPFLIGAAFQNGEIKAGFHGLVDHAALWNRALSNEEIVALSGGSDEVAQRTTEILGEESDRLQYWRPRGHNTRAGDCMPFFHDGVYHLYYLVVRRNHHGKWQSGHGGLQIDHASSTDLVHWKHHPMAIPISEQWESWWGTGDFVYHGGTYYTFQKVPSMLKEFDCGGIHLATSPDGIHFTKHDKKPFLPGFDCDLHEDKETGIFHLLTGGKQTSDGRPTIKRFFSCDLMNWEEAEEPFIVTDARFNISICPHLFEWNGWYYFMAGFTESSGVWLSHDLFGPWTLHKPHKLDFLAVPKTAPFTGDRRIFAGFLEDRGWGGNLVFRELIQHGDGALGTKFPPEMVPISGEAMDLTFKSLTPGASGSGRTIQIRASDSFERGMVTGVPRDVRITLNVAPRADASCFGLCMRGSDNCEKGCELRFEPSKQRVQFAIPHQEQMEDDWRTTSTDVEGLDQPFTLDIILKDDIVDVCIDNRRTMVTRYSDLHGDRLFFFGQNADVSFDSVEIRPLSA